MTEIEQKQAVEAAIKEQATNAAELYFAKNAKELIAKGLGSEDAKEAIKSIASEALASLNIKDVDGKDIALPVLLKEISDQAEKMATRLEKMEDNHAVMTKSFETEIKEKMTAQLDELKSLKDNRNANVRFDIKAAANIMISTNYSGGTVGLTSWDSAVAKAPRRQPFMRELVRVLPTGNLYIAWAEIKNPDGGAGSVAEGAAKPQADFDIVEATAKVEKIAVWMKASKESLADIAFLQAEINSELRELLELELDTQILSGDGVAPHLKGILTYVPAFTTGGGFSGSIPFANQYDAIVAAISQVQQANFNPNAVIVNPIDYYKLMLTKDTQGNYIRPQFMADGSYVIAGLRVVANNGVAVGTFVVGDFTKSNLAVREEINFQIGYVNDDFTKNLVTILAELRAVHYIKSNHVKAFVKGTFSDVIADITAPVAP